MSKVKLFSCNSLIILGMLLILTSGGCISIPKSPAPRFYKLQGLHQNPDNVMINIVSNVMVGVGPVKIPEYQNRPQIVTKNKDNTIKFAQFDRWGESLDLAVARLIKENLTVFLPTYGLISYPWDQTTPVRYQVLAEILQLESSLDNELFMATQWQIIDMRTSKTVLIKRSTFMQSISPHDYRGLIQSLSSACVSLSREMADAFIELESPHP